MARDIARTFAEDILALMDRNQTCHPEGKPQPFVAAFGENLVSLALAGLALGEIQSTVFKKLPMMAETAQIAGFR